jgi:multidrug transporter EmrE-like cation transporter
MAIMNVIAMTASELFANAHLKWFAENGKSEHLAIGVLAWLVVLFFLIESLKNKSFMWTVIMWEAMIVVGGAVSAYWVFGESFESLYPVAWRSVRYPRRNMHKL